MSRDDSLILKALKFYKELLENTHKEYADIDNRFASIRENDIESYKKLIEKYEVIA